MAQAATGFSVEAVNRRLKEEASKRRRRRGPLKGKPKPVSKPANPKARRKPIDYYEGLIPHQIGIGEDGQPYLIKQGRPGKYTRKDGKFILNPEWPYPDEGKNKSSSARVTLPIGRKPSQDSVDRMIRKNTARHADKGGEFKRPKSLGPKTPGKNRKERPSPPEDVKNRRFIRKFNQEGDRQFEPKPSSKPPAKKYPAPDPKKRSPRDPWNSPYRKLKRKSREIIENDIFEGNVRKLNLLPGVPKHGGLNRPKPPSGFIEKSSVITDNPPEKKRSRGGKPSQEAVDRMIKKNTARHARKSGELKIPKSLGPKPPNVDKRYPRSYEDKPSIKKASEEITKLFDDNILGGNLEPLNIYPSPTHGGAQRPKPPRGFIEKSSTITDTPKSGVTKGALERRLKNKGNKEHASKEKKRSRGGKPQWQPPDSLAPQYRGKGGLKLIKTQPELKVKWYGKEGEKGDKNYTQSPDSEDYQWHRDRRVRKSQGRPIEETPKQKKARLGEETGSVRRKNREEEERAKKKGYKPVTKGAVSRRVNKNSAEAISKKKQVRKRSKAEMDAILDEADRRDRAREKNAKKRKPSFRGVR